MQPLFRYRRDRLDRLRRQREEAVEAAARRSAIPENGTQTCPGCGAEVAPGMTFCSQCGARVE